MTGASRSGSPCLPTTRSWFLLDPLELEGLAWASTGDLERFVNPSRTRRWKDSETLDASGLGKEWVE